MGFSPLKPILVHAAPSELADFHLGSFECIFRGRQPSSFCMTDSCHLVLLDSPGSPQKPACAAHGEAEGQVRKLTREPVQWLFPSGHDTDRGFGAKISKKSPNKVRRESRGQRKRVLAMLKGGWRTRALLWRLLLSTQHSSKAELHQPAKSAWVTSRRAGLMPRLHACQGKPGAGSPRQAALGIKSPYTELRPAGLQMRGGKSPPGFSMLPPSVALCPWKLTLAGTRLWCCRWGSHACCGQEWPQPLSSSHLSHAALLASPHSPQTHTRALSAKLAKSIRHLAAKTSPGPRGLCWEAILAGLGWVSHTTCTPVTPQLG